MKPASQITDFEVKGKRRQEILVYVNDELWATLDPETVVRAGLKRGMPFPPDLRDALLAQDEALRARRAAAGYCARGPRTRRELENYLREKNFSAAAAEAAIQYLESSGTLNETETAALTIRKRRRAGHGPRRIEAELVARGMPGREIAGEMARALEGVDLQAECEALARKAAARYQPLADVKQRKKLADYLLRRGFEGEMVAAAIRKIPRASDAQ